MIEPQPHHAPEPVAVTAEQIRQTLGIARGGTAEQVVRYARIIGHRSPHTIITAGGGRLSTKKKQIPGIPVGRDSSSLETTAGDIRGLIRCLGVLYEERSRKGIGDFPLRERINGYWDLDRHGD